VISRVSGGLGDFDSARRYPNFDVMANRVIAGRCVNPSRKLAVLVHRVCELVDKFATISML
jgi:hypothetical protein